uniref:Uncharacterized protein n=1 Tax=Glossina austeni TaxID=7395 RepID=A0A1A9UX11_GLOAU
MSVDPQPDFGSEENSDIKFYDLHVYPVECIEHEAAGYREYRNWIVPISLQTSRQSSIYCRSVLTRSLKEAVLTQQPETIKDSEHPIRVCRPKKSLHSLEQGRRRLWEQLEKEGEDPFVFEFYGDSCEVCSSDSIVKEEYACKIDERRETRTYIAAIVRQMQQSYATIQEVADNLGGTEYTATAEQKCSEEKVAELVQQSGQQEIDPKINGTTEKIEKIQEKQDILKTRVHKVYQQIDGHINALEGKVDDALSQFDARLNVLEEKITKVISQFDAKVEDLEEKIGETWSQLQSYEVKSTP